MIPRRSIRAAALFLVALSGGMLSLRVYFYPLFFSQDGAAKLFFETFALLLIYAGFVVWQTRNHYGPGQALLTRITSLGMVAGTVQVIHLGVERFIDIPVRWNDYLLAMGTGGIPGCPAPQ